MNINECGCRPYGWLGLDGDRCIRVIPRHPPFSMKEEALPACKETIVRNILWSLRDRVMQPVVDPGFSKWGGAVLSQMGGRMSFSALL